MNNLQTIQYVYERLVKGNIKELVSEVIVELVQEANIAILGLAGSEELYEATELCMDIVEAVRKENERRKNSNLGGLH